ncbi:MAG: FAD-dependent oxidoreductase [Desulfobacterales bacterium]|jgi:thioredoxin reductase
MPQKKNYDVIILGTGPAGLQAAIHAARKKVSVLVLGKETKSSLFHAHVENFCCIFNITGEEMLNVGRQQAANFGADLLDEDVLSILPDGQQFKIISESGTELICRSLIVATGTARNKLGAPGEKEFLGRGVSYCVECDANFFKGEDVVFIELGARGVMELATHIGIQFDDEMKYIATNKKMETNVPGVFAAGDICGPPWQMAKAVGEGCVAGIAAATYAKKSKKSD